MPGGGEVSSGQSQRVQLVPPVSVMDEAVERALASAKHATEHDLLSGTGMRPNSFFDPTRSHDQPVPEVDFRPLAKPEPPKATFHALQEWEGYIVEIEAEEFVARLVDLTAGHSHETEEVTIPLDEVSEDDASRMTEGSIFRWVIGYEHSPGGTRKRVSQIVFRDLPRMTESDIAAGRAWAKRMVAALRQ